MIMVSLQSFIEYLARLLNRGQKRERQTTVLKMGARLLLLTKLRFDTGVSQGVDAPPLNPPAERWI